MNNLSDHTVEELTAALEVAKHRAQAEANKLRESVTPIKRITIEPVEPKFDRLYDDAVRWYRIEGVCINKDELEAVGASKPMEGGINYLFNIATGKFIMRDGGGTIHLPNGKSGYTGGAEQWVMDELAEIVLSNPDKTTDITDFCASVTDRTPTE